MFGYKEKEMEQDFHGITRVFRVYIEPEDILRYYLGRMSLFSEDDSNLILSRWAEPVIDAEDNIPILDELETCLHVAIETHSNGFKKVISKKRLFDTHLKKSFLQETTDYIFEDMIEQNWRWLWTFELKNYLSVEEYLKVVGKGYQVIGSEEQHDIQEKSYPCAHGEELDVWLDVSKETMILAGNYGRFKAYYRRHYEDYKIPEENILLRIHPGVKNFEVEPQEWDYESGSRYRGDEKYRKWNSYGSGQIFWEIELFDAHGIKERENLIKEPNREQL